MADKAGSSRMDLGTDGACIGCGALHVVSGRSARLCLGDHRKRPTKGLRQRNSQLHEKNTDLGEKQSLIFVFPFLMMSIMSYNELFH